MITGAGFLNLPYWQSKLQDILTGLNRQDFLRLPVLGAENVERPWVALEAEDFYSAVSTGILFASDHKISRYPERLVTDDAQLALNRLKNGQKSQTFYKAAIGATFPFLRILSGDGEIDPPTKFYVQNDAVAGFILSYMERHNCNLEKAAAAAQWEKIAVSNPNPSLHGLVTRNRLALQIAEIFKLVVPLEKIPVTGVSSIDLQDLQIADSYGYSIRLLGLAEKKDGSLKAAVEPCLIPKKFFLAQARGGSEIIYTQDRKGQGHVYACPGTSEETQVRGIIADLNDIATGSKDVEQLQMCESVESFCDRFYLRFRLVNLTSTLAQLLGMFSTAGIDIESILQPEEVSRETESTSTVILLTGRTDTGKLQSAISQINSQLKLASLCSFFKLFR
ncbi:MAG: hypothetical protein ACOYXC_14225 [Candidatus Rifleibacteriota bacterium]